MDNLISRQYLIDRLKIKEKCDDCEWKDGVRCSKHGCFVDACEAIFEAPSIQPEIIRCHECAKRRTLDCPMGITVFDAPDADGYCYKAERREG